MEPQLVARVIDSVHAACQALGHGDGPMPSERQLMLLADAGARLIEATEIRQQRHRQQQQQQQQQQQARPTSGSLDGLVEAALARSKWDLPVSILCITHEQIYLFGGLGARKQIQYVSNQISLSRKY